jgi:catecholate siderophore receptor
VAAPQGAQSPSATSLVRGTVLDETRAAIAGVQVTAVAEDAVPAGSTATDQGGAFALMLPPGHYTLRVSAVGFEGASQRVTTSLSGPITTEFVLQVAVVREEVSVVAPAGDQVEGTRTATKTLTPLRDVPQSVTVVTQALIKDQMMMSVGDVMRYVPGVTVHQGENNRDQVIIRGNNSSADFFVDGVRDDVQYYRDLYNLDRVETLKGPNAMIFGRGGAGGVVNRVTKTAGLQAARDISLQGGMFANKRLTAGVNQPLSETVALRLDGMFEDSDSFRDFVGLHRYGVTPTLTYAPTRRTRVTLRYEYLDDSRVADRGITSFQGLPADVDVSTYYGNPDASHVSATVNVASGTVEHQFGTLTLRNQTLVANYDRGYQNFVPGATTAGKQQVALTAYNNATERTNVFNQTDATAIVATGRIRHTLLAGAEFGHQMTDNFRNTGYFNNATTSVLVPYADPTISTPVTFRQSATDADNHLTTNVAAVYGQDQVELSRHLQVVGGLRFDRFDLTYHNNRDGDTLARPDNLLSPRAGIVLKPTPPLSIYSSYSVSHVPSSGDQLSSLTNVTEQVKPEQIRNYEIGAKWDAAQGLSLTTAVYRLNRTNTRSTDPNDPTRIVQTGSQRTNGYEIGMNGRVAARWTIAGGYAYQDAFVTSATITAVAGAQVAQVPHHTLSLWNNLQVHPRVSIGVGVLSRSEMFAAIDNTVRLPGYTRVDAAGFFSVTHRVRLQANVENLFDKRYYTNADSNTNISPGSPRALRVGVTASF